MRVLLQRVLLASVAIAGKEIARCSGPGLLLFLGILKGDTEKEAQWLAEKIGKLRLWNGDDGSVNRRTIKDIGGGILVVSQFTLAGDVSDGNRPDYTSAMPPADAEKLYNLFIQKMQSTGIPVAAGTFGAMMEVSLVNDGPVTLILER
ncbi:MAG: D-aminoacyl-tRNA deacylase [Patescibacteria group bacterium]